MTRPLANSDPVLLHLSGQPHATTVLAIASWAWILVRGPDMHLYLEVAINKSAVSWSRLVRLDADVSAKDLERIEQIASNVANHPDRKDVADVPGAAVLCQTTDQITRP